MPKKTSFKSSVIDNLKCKVTSVIPHNPDYKNNGAYLVVVYLDKKYRTNKFIKIKFVGTKENQLKRYINRPISIDDIRVYENENGIYYSCYDTENIKYNFNPFR